MLGRFATATTRRSVAFTTLPRAAASALPQQRSFHSGAPARSEEKPSTLSTVTALASDWKFAVPAAIVLGVPAFHLEVIQLSEETMLVAVFMTFVATCYTQVGPMVHKALGEKGASVITEFRAMEASRAVKLEEQLKALSTQATLLDDMKDIYAMQDGVMTKMAAAKTVELQHAVYADAIARLEAIVATEARAMTAMQQNTVQTVCDAADQAMADPFSKYAFTKLALHRLTGSLGDVSKIPGVEDQKAAAADLKELAASNQDVAADAFSEMLSAVATEAGKPAGKPTADEKSAAYKEYLDSIKLPAMPAMITWPTGLDKPEDLAMPMPK